MRKYESEQELLLIGGHPKSGTTLLLSLFDNHKQLLTFPEELKWFTNIKRIKCKYKKFFYILTKTGAFAPSIKEMNENITSGSRNYKDIDNLQYYTGLVNGLKKLLKKSDKLKLNFIFENYANVKKIDTTKVKYYVEKTPFNELYTENVESEYKKFKMIYVVRDPRDNYFSYKRKQKELSINQFCYNWSESVKSALRTKMVHIVKYEDLISKPNDTLKLICNFLKIDFNETLLRPTRGGDIWEGNSMFGENRTNKIHSNALKQRWKKLSDWEINKIESLLYNKMKLLGYNPCSASKNKINIISFFPKVILKRFI